MPKTFSFSAQYSAPLPLLGGLFAALLLSQSVSAQQELMLHAMPEIWHSNATNPAFFPQNKIVAIGLPGIGLDAAHSGNVTYNDIFVKKGDRNTLNFSNALAKLDPINTIDLEQRIETVSLGFRLPGKFWLSAAHANRLSGSITYPKALPALIWEGNAAYIGQTVEIAPQANLSNWNEWSVGLAKTFGNLQLGVRGKYLSGTAALLTDANRNTAAITTSDDIYQLSLATNYAFYSATVISAFDTAGLGFNLALGEINGRAFSKNSGYAFDIGAQYQLNERITLDFSLLDLGGKINWKTASNYFESQGEYQYDGVYLPGADIINGSDSLDFATKLDTLNDIFKFSKRAQEFETTLPLRAYLGGQYAFGKRWIFGLSAFYQKRMEEKATVAMGVSARWKPLKWMSLGAMYSANERSAANLGFQVGLKPGPVQLYFASDNLLNSFSIKNNSAVNLRAGLSLIF